jgi:uncharacterized protein YggE
MVTAKIRTVDKTSAIIDAVSTVGGDATRINGVSLSVENPQGYFGEARDKAMASSEQNTTKIFPV